MLVGLHVATNFEMYRQNSEKALSGGGGEKAWIDSCGAPSSICSKIIILQMSNFKSIDANSLLFVFHI